MNIIVKEKKDLARTWEIDLETEGIIFYPLYSGLVFLPRKNLRVTSNHIYAPLCYSKVITIIQVQFFFTL